MIALDMIGNEIAPGDILADQRGSVYVADETEPGFIGGGVIRVHHPRTQKQQYMRLQFALRLSGQSRTLLGSQLRELWRRLYDEHVRPANADELRERKKKIKHPSSHGRHGI